MTKHGAKFSDDILDVASRVIGREIETRVLLDPFAGTGRAYEIEAETNTWAFGIEIEPEFAKLNTRTFLGNSETDIPRWFEPDTVDVIFTSPCYGNRMADIDMRESCAGTYSKWLGRKPNERSAGGMRWGQKYWDLHSRVWGQVTDVARRGALFVLNTKDFPRNYKRVHVGLWHLNVLTSLGWAWVGHETVGAPGQNFGSNMAHKVDVEDIFVLRLQ